VYSVIMFTNFLSVLFVRFHIKYILCSFVYSKKHGCRKGISGMSLRIFLYVVLCLRTTLLVFALKFSLLAHSLI